MTARRPAALAVLLLSAGPALAEAPEPVAVTVTDKGCEPAALTVPAGKSVFRISNKSRRVLEWEILQGTMIVEERENIIPGFVQSLSATLQPGRYEMTCGLLSNPKGTLTVTAAAAAAPGAPDPMALVGPLAAYKLYVMGEVEAFHKQTAAFVEAVKAGRIGEAKALYPVARRHYERIEPVASLFNDLDKSMDVRADDFERKEADPGFTGFHRLEKGLWADASTEGLGAYADRLLADATELKRRITDLTIPPAKMVGGAAGLIEEVAATKISGEEDRYSRTDLWDFHANVEGARKIFDLLRPLVAARDPDFVARTEKNFSRVDALLGKYRTEDGGFTPFDALSDRDRNALKGPITVLAEDLSTLRGKLGLD
ncbi:iron uptake system protein EfeO [Methylobacterium currus]|uniref:Iron uptake system protein EfeO n=1 Tax=Methylobacterium currus TaxID=2051553 RepID=A0A2R4WNI6_9HYPH|nr:iron uptake system protein EfeO [Methylobacterium currus]AWB23114.1 iron uptake system protein EfeO [Methylobacterium currus]UHC17145.1 iron uptake system protein EfeO [Methylobacterium currus]